MFWLVGPPLIVVYNRFKSHVKKICCKAITLKYSNTTCRYTKHFVFVEKLFSSFFFFAFNFSKNDYRRRVWYCGVPTTSHTFELSSPFLTRTSSTILISAMLCSTQCIFALHVWGVYPRSRPKGPKIDTKYRKRIEVLEEGAASPPPPHQLGDLGESSKLPSGPAQLRGSARGHIDQDIITVHSLK